jgi:hypothetical protein
MDSQSFTLFHVALSVIGIVSGLVVLHGLLAARSNSAITAVFLLTTIATSVTGFFFSRDHLLPSHIVGIISLVLLAAATAALYLFHLRSAWRGVYVVGAVASLYLNAFVLVVQGFLKVPALHALAPNGSEPPFVATQAIVLVLFIVLGYRAVRRFRAYGSANARQGAHSH